MLVLVLVLITTFVLPLTAGAPKPANTTDLAGSYVLVNGTLDFCTKTLQLETSNHELTVIKFEDYPLKCELPRELERLVYPASDRRSSTTGTSVIPFGTRLIICSGMYVKMSLFRQLRDAAWSASSGIGVSNDYGLKLRQGVLYLELGEVDGFSVSKNCLYEAKEQTREASESASSKEPNSNSSGSDIGVTDSPSGNGSSTEQTPSGGNDGNEDTPSGGKNENEVISSGNKEGNDKPTTTSDSGLSVAGVVATIVAAVITGGAAIVAAIIGVRCVRKRSADKEQAAETS